MIVHQINTQNSVLNTFLSEIRNESIQNDSMRFRRNIERIGEILGYELSKKLNYSNKSVKTPYHISTQLTSAHTQAHTSPHKYTHACTYPHTNTPPHKCTHTHTHVRTLKHKAHCVEEGNGH